MKKTPATIVREMEQTFISGQGTKTSKYVTTDLYDDANKIYAYLDSKHTSGSTDSMGRDKPFFNIVLSARNIYYRATDIDRKHVEITASKSIDVVPAFLATQLIQDWMRKENFGAFLNNWGMELAGFNSAVVKFIETDGKLHPMVAPWSRFICDSVNFDANPKIEVLELTDAELRQRKYDNVEVEKLIEANNTRETTSGEKKDNKTGYHKVYELHGMLPLSFITEKEKDYNEYVQQMHVVSYVASKQNGKYDEFTLASGREEKDPYMLTSLLPSTDGSVSLNGSVKNLFEAQWMMNHTAKSIKDQLDIASKLVFQTADTNFIGRNVLTAIEQGDILIHEVDKPVTQMNNSSHDITAQQSFGNMWKGLANEINGVSESMLGNTAPSGTAWRQVEALLSESYSLFELMTENKGLALEQMFREHVIPHIKKKMNTDKEITAILDDSGIAKIDQMYIPAEAKRRYNKEAVSKVMDALETGDMSSLPEGFDQARMEQGVKKEMSMLGNQRFFKPSELEGITWNDVLKDLEWNLTINITGEAMNKNTVLTTLTTALAAIANPAYADNPQAQLVVSKILNATGVISPLEVASTPAPTQQPSGTAPPPLPVPDVTQGGALPTKQQ